MEVMRDDRVRVQASEIMMSKGDMFRNDAGAQLGRRPLAGRTRPRGDEVT